MGNPLHKSGKFSGEITRDQRGLLTPAGRLSLVTVCLLIVSVENIRYVSAGLSSLADALGEQVLNLSVNRAKVVLCPGGNLLIKLMRQAQRNLLFGHL